MEVCRSTREASSPVHGAASPYMDPEFEFNAPRFYDFQRNDLVSSPPSSEGDTYFDTSKVKELCTPERSSGDENNEDTAQLLKNIQKVREELRQEEEATSKMTPSMAGAKSPLALPTQQGGAQSGRARALAELAAAPAMEKVQEEKIVVSGTVRAVGPMRVRPAEGAEDMSGRLDGAQAAAPGHPSVGRDGAKAGNASMAEARAAALAAAQQPGCKQEQTPVQGSSARSAGGLSERHPCIATGQQQGASAPGTEAAADSLQRTGVATAVCGAGAAPAVSVLGTSSQNPPGPTPWPTHPARVALSQPAVQLTAAAEQITGVKAAGNKKAAPGNLVTAWGPRGVPQAPAPGGTQAPAQRLSSGLVAPGTSSLVHTAGKSRKTPVASRDEAPKQKATGTGASAKLLKEASSSAATVSQQGNKRLDRRPEAIPMPTQTRKRHAEQSQQGRTDIKKGASSKRQKVTASHQKGTTATTDAVRAGARAPSSSKSAIVKQAETRLTQAQPAKGPAPRDKPVQHAKAAQKDRVVPKSPRLGSPRSPTTQDTEPEMSVRLQQSSRQPSRKPGAGKRQLTEARTPQLRTSKRRRTAHAPALPPVQDQEEWKPLALMVAEFEASTPARFNHGPRAVQYVPPPQPDPGARVAAPDLATEARLRPSRFKPHEEQELEDIASHPSFHALPLNAAVIGSRGSLGVRLVPARPVTRSHTPNLATRARAAAHPTLGQGIKPAPVQKAPFDPHKLTVPQSPAFATRARLRAQGVKPVEPAGQGFTFKAQKAPDHGIGQVASRPHNSRRRQTSSIRPFQLHTDARARTQHPSSCEAELGKVPAFHAAPVPKTLYRPAQLPAVPEAKPTEQQAFQLLSKARHQQAVAEQETRLRAERAHDRRKSSFRAAPPPRFPQPPPPARSERPPTRALTPKLAVETRSTQRAAFDAVVAKNRRKDEEKRAAEAAERVVEEARELKDYRSQLTFKARPMPLHSSGPQRAYVLPEPKMTVPLSPQLQTRSRARLPG